MKGLVLEGGGGKGAYQIGACKALKELGITFRVVAGASVGALNGAMIVQDDLDRAYEIWHDMHPSRIINFSEDELNQLNIIESKGDSVHGIFSRVKKIIREKGIDIKPLKELVNEVVDEDRIRKSNVDFGIVTIDLTAKKPVEVYKEDIPEGKLSDYLIASASFPGFSMQNIDGRLFVDGGLYNSIPVNLVKDKGVKDIVVIRIYGFGRVKKFDTSDLNITYICPSESLGSMLDFGNRQSRKNLKLGYYDTLRVFKGLKGRRYYIKPFNDDNFFLSYFASMSEVKVQRISNLFGIEAGSGKRVLFENIIPRIAELLGLSQEATYEDISVGLIESFAESCGIERFKVYGFKELFSEVLVRYKPESDETVHEIPRFLRSSEMVSKMIRQRILSNIAAVLFDEME
jgi:NTE family protein